jgi:hypothetical protein
MAQQSLTPTGDWLDALIGPGGLLLLVPTFSSVSFMGEVAKKSK